MKKKILIFLMQALLPTTLMAQTAGGQITRKKANTTAATAAPKKTTPTPKKTTAAAKSHSSGKPRSATAGMTQAQKDRIIQNLINNMVYVEGGTFMMGATSTLDNEKSAHQVTLLSFSIGRYEVTQEEWMAVMDNNPSEFKSSRRPVECVNWEDCQAFISKLNALTGRQFRLPSEAEWEFAARGGNKSMGYEFSGSNNVGDVAWCHENAEDKTHVVGTKAPNELGLYDMSGNVWEWCQDWYATGISRVCRGGGWRNVVGYCSVFDRYSYNSFRMNNLGLRLACNSNAPVDTSPRKTEPNAQNEPASTNSHDALHDWLYEYINE